MGIFNLFKKKNNNKAEIKENESVKNKFEYNEEIEQFLMKVDNIDVVCDELYDGCEKRAEELIEAYPNKINNIAEYMIEEITEFFGEITIEELIKSLGKPTIDVGGDIIKYLEHTLDDTHIIEVEFDGQFDEFLSINIDG